MLLRSWYLATVILTALLMGTSFAHTLELPIPQDWAEWRRQWEYSHATRFVLHLAGFAVLLFPVSRFAAEQRLEQVERRDAL